MIQASGLTKVFKDKKRGDIRAVDGVSFTCTPGKIYGLLGANGAGKTTALRMVATLLKPSGGTVTVGGCDAASEPERVRSKIGFLAASTALYGRLTTRETIAYFARLHGLPEERIASRTEELSRELGLAEFLDRRVDKFSTGMKQRTSIARTVVHDPEVLIMDEPTLGLDVMTSRNIVRFVRNCRDRGKTVVYSTHVMSEAEKLCDVIGIIHKGRLVAEGGLDELRERYREKDLEEIFVKAVDAKEEDFA